MANESVPQPVTNASTASTTSAATTSTSAPKASKASQSKETFNGNTKLNTLEDLKKKSPQLYNMMMQGIAMNIVNEMKKHQDNLVKIMREAEQNANRR